MKFCLKLVTVFTLITQLLGFGVSTYWVAPKIYEIFVKVGTGEVDQKSGIITIHPIIDSFMVREMTSEQLREYSKPLTEPADRKFKLTFHQKTFQKSEGVAPETLAAAIISIDRGRNHNSMIRLVNNIQRGRSNEDSISSLNRIRHVNTQVLATMPRGGPEQIALHYFQLKSGLFSPEQLAMEYQCRGLIPDPQAQIADNGQDPSFAYDYPNATQWVLHDASAHSLTFDEATVSCDRCTAWVGGDWWFAGVKRV